MNKEWEESIKRSHEKYQENKRRQQKYKEDLKKGRKFFRENLNYFSFSIGNYVYIDVGYKILNNIDILYNISVCSDKDCEQRSEKLAKGIIGNRFLKEEFYTIETIGSKYKEEIIMIDIYRVALEMADIVGPFRKLKKEVVRELKYSKC